LRIILKRLSFFYAFSPYGSIDTSLIFRNKLKNSFSILLFSICKSVEKPSVFIRESLHHFHAIFERIKGIKCAVSFLFKVKGLCDRRGKNHLFPLFGNLF